MQVFLTDSIYYRDHQKGFIFANTIFSWKIKKKGEDFSVSSRIENTRLRNKLLNEKIVAVISPSNYKLLYDIRQLNISKIYTPESFEKGIPVKINRKEVDLNFNNFLKRGYLSYLNFTALQKMGFNRIEQFVITLRVFLSESMIVHDNLLFGKELYVESVKKSREKTVVIKKLRLPQTLNLIGEELGLDFQEATKLILQLYSEFAISDPFDPNGFVLLNENREYANIIELLKNVINKKISYDVFLITAREKDGTAKTRLSVRKLTSMPNPFLDAYLCFQKEDYFKGKALYATGKPRVVHNLFSFGKFFPIKDTILTIKSLIKLEKIEENKGGLIVLPKTKSRLSVKRNISWVSLKTWEDIYSRDVSEFAYFLSEMHGPTSNFRCPLCGEKEMLITPLRVFCKNQGCNFRFDRTTLNIVGVRVVSEDKMEEAFSNNVVFVKNKNGKNFISYLRNRDHYYFLSLKKEDDPVAESREQPLDIEPEASRSNKED